MKKERIRKTLALFLAVITLCLSTGILSSAAASTKSASIRTQTMYYPGLKAVLSYDGTIEKTVVTLTRETKHATDFDPVQWADWGTKAECLLAGDVDRIPEGFCEGWEKLSYVYIDCKAKEKCSVGSFAFKGCPSLREVLLGEGVAYVGKEAFYGNGNEYEALYSFLVMNPGMEIYGFGKDSGTDTKDEAQKALGADRDVSYFEPADNGKMKNGSTLQSYCMKYGLSYRAIDNTYENIRYQQLSLTEANPKPGLIYWLLTHLLGLFQ